MHADGSTIRRAIFERGGHSIDVIKFVSGFRRGPRQGQPSSNFYIYYEKSLLFQSVSPVMQLLSGDDGAGWRDHFFTSPASLCGEGKVKTGPWL